jgi:hypothetical protein
LTNSTNSSLSSRFRVEIGITSERNPPAVQKRHRRCTSSMLPNHLHHDSLYVSVSATGLSSPALMTIHLASVSSPLAHTATQVSEPRRHVEAGYGAYGEARNLAVSDRRTRHVEFNENGLTCRDVDKDVVRRNVQVNDTETVYGASSGSCVLFAVDQLVRLLTR